jgi:drug/metabolite transporter (DMT)-like permease
MLLLLIVSFIWAFSFGLIKGLGHLDPTAVAVVRLAVSLIVFAPLFRPRALGAAGAARLAAVGALQFGAMYLLYLRSFASLHAYEVALFTITTPLMVALFDAALERRWRARYAAAAALSVAGAGIIVWNAAARPGMLGGLALVQLSNACFAAGQLAWRRERARTPAAVPDASLFAAALVGALLLTAAASLATTHWGEFDPTAAEWAKLVYLGAVASGAGFFLWNRGASRVNAGTLAAFNNAKIPLAVACSLVFFGEKADIPRLVAGGALLAAGVWAAGAARDKPVS